MKDKNWEWLVLLPLCVGFGAALVAAACIAVGGFCVACGCQESALGVIVNVTVFFGSLSVASAVVALAVFWILSAIGRI